MVLYEQTTENILHLQTLQGRNRAKNNVKSETAS